MKAICNLTNVSDKKISGYIQFTEIMEKGAKSKRVSKLKINVQVSGLSPGLHGFHIHESGNLIEGCSSTCKHFNPDNCKHGDILDRKKNRHAGDLGNIKVDRHGICNQVIYDKLLRLHGKYSILGRSVVIHENEDDLGRGGNKESERTGNAGKRIACGVVGVL